MEELLEKIDGETLNELKILLKNGKEFESLKIIISKLDLKLTEAYEFNDFLATKFNEKSIDSKDLEEIDELIYKNSILYAIKKIKEVYKVGLKEALDLIYDRYDYLRETNNDKFLKSKEEYWNGFYS